MPYTYLTRLLMGAAIVLTAPTVGHADIDQIIVTASPRAKPSSELATPITVLSREDLVRQGGATLGELLSQLPGVTDSSFARGASRPIIRGLDNFRIRLQENGVGSHDVSDLSEDHGAPIDPLAAQRVEIIRGPATLRYGSQAIGGVVSVLNNRIPNIKAEKGVGGEVYAGYTSVDDSIETSALLDFGTSSFAGHVDAFYRDADDYDVPTSPGVQANTHNESTGFAAGGSVLFDGGYLGGSISYFESEYGIPGGEAAEEEVFIDLEQTKFAVKGEKSWDGTFIETLRFDLGYSDYTHDEVIGADGIVGSTFDNEEWESRIEVLHGDLGPFTGAVGLQYGKRDLQGSGEAGELISPAERESFAVFLFEEIELNEAVTFQMAGRVEHVEEDGFGVTLPSFDGSLLGAEIDDFGAQRSVDFTPISGSLGMVWDVGADMALGTSLQYVERAPDLLELFAKGPHESTETFEIGNPDLDKEKAVSLDVTLKRNEGPFTFDLAAFYTSYEGYIFKNFTGLVCGEEFDTCGLEGAPGVEDELTQIAYTQADADFYGFEASAKWEAVKIDQGTIGFDARFDVVKAEFDSGGNVPRITPIRYGAGIFLETETVFARLSALRVSEQDDVAVNETETKGYTDLRAEVSFTPDLPNLDKGAFEIGLVGRNLLDEDQRNHVSFKKEDVLLPGASVRVFLKLQF